MIPESKSSPGAKTATATRCARERTIPRTRATTLGTGTQVWRARMRRKTGRRCSGTEWCSQSSVLASDVKVDVVEETKSVVAVADVAGVVVPLRSGAKKVSSGSGAWLRIMPSVW